MKAKARKSRSNLTQEEIDGLVVAQADDDAAWDKPVHVKRSHPIPLTLPGDLAARAAFLARLHRAGHVDEWLARIIRERIELEESAFADAKRALSKEDRQLMPPSAQHRRATKRL